MIRGEVSFFSLLFAVPNVRKKRFNNSDKVSCPLTFFFSCHPHPRDIFVVHGKKEDICSEVARLATPVLDDMGMELVDVELRREQRDLVLTLFIDREGGVTLDHCAEVSHEVGTLFDVEDVLSGPYRLEVSSPGLDRPLKKLADFERFTGRPAKIKTRVPCDPDGSGHSRKTFRGLLRGVDGERILLQPEGKNEGEIRFLFAEIEKANLEFS